MQSSTIGVQVQVSLLASSLHFKSDPVSRWQQAAAHIAMDLPEKIHAHAVNTLADFVEDIEHPRLGTLLRQDGLASLLSRNQSDWMPLRERLEEDLTSDQRIALNAVTLSLERLIGTVGPVRISLFTSPKQLHTASAVGGLGLYLKSDLASLHVTRFLLPEGTQQRVANPIHFRRHYGPLDLRAAADYRLGGRTYPDVVTNAQKPLVPGVMLRLGALTLMNIDANDARERAVQEIIPTLSPVDVLLISGPLETDEPWFSKAVRWAQAHLVILANENRALMTQPGEWWNFSYGLDENSFALLSYEPESSRLSIVVKDDDTGAPLYYLSVNAAKRPRIQRALMERVRPAIEPSIIAEFNRIYGVGALNGTMGPAAQFISFLESNPYLTRSQVEDKLASFHSSLALGAPEGTLIDEAQYANCRAFEALVAAWKG